MPLAESASSARSRQSLHAVLFSRAFGNALGDELHHAGCGRARPPVLPIGISLLGELLAIGPRALRTGIPSAPGQTL